jgi:hypothetical protein
MFALIGLELPPREGLAKEPDIDESFLNLAEEVRKDLG